MRKRRSDSSKQDALSRILQVAVTKSAKSIAYVAAALGIMYLIPGLKLPPELAAIASSIGIQMMGSIIDRVANGKSISDDEIRKAVEDAVSQSSVEMLTREDFYHAFAQLRKGQRALQARGDDSLAILHDLESTLHRLESMLPAAKPQVTSLEELQFIHERIEDHLHKQITKEKNNKRYIPDVFVEVARVKDKSRFFAHPVLFLNKVVEAIGRLNFSRLNAFLLKLSLEPISLDLPAEVVETIDEVENQVLRLSDTLLRLKKRVSAYASLEPEPSLESIIPPGRRYVYREIWFPLGGTGGSLTRQIDECVDDLKVIESRVLFIIARAGQGKTNFVCDFAENVLCKRSIPCLLFTGQELRHVAPDRIGEYVVKTVFGDRYGSIEEMLKDLERLCSIKQTPAIIIIDGINEHSNIGAFSLWLEKVIEGVLEHRFVKVILTCRSEYFDQRFDNLRKASFADTIRFVDDFEQWMSSTHRDHLLEAYFHFFNMNCQYLSARAEETLQHDTLLLRMFCEAYGDHNATNVIQLPQVMDIYKDEVFRIYLDKKLEEVSKRGMDSSLGIGERARYKKALSQVVHLMVGREQFADIPIADLEQEHYAALREMIDEGLIFRKDIVEGRSVLDEKSEVINFTFDEFRDFLLADYLIMVIFKEDADTFRDTVERFTNANSPVAEGVSKYIFLASKHPECRDVHEVVAGSPWYRKAFLECIFSVREDRITQEDLAEIQSMFFESAEHSRWIIHSLIRRYRTDVYSTLNIHLLFKILDTLDESAYDRLVKPTFSMPQWYSEAWPIERLVNNIRKILMEGPDDRPCFEYLAELLIYLFGIEGPDGTLPAYKVFAEFVKCDADVAVSLLKKHSDAHNRRIASRVWQMLADLLYEDNMPGSLIGDLADEASQLLAEADDENQERSELLWAVGSFLMAWQRTESRVSE